MSTSFLTYSQLATMGHTSRGIQALLEQNVIRKVRPGFYLPFQSVDPLQEHRERMEAAQTLTHPGNAFSHSSAAVLHQLPVRSMELGQVTMTRTTSGHGDQTPSLKVRASRLDEEEITDVSGMRVTTLGRTASDQLRVQPFTWGVITADAARRHGLSAADLSASIDRHPRLHGVSKARRVASLADPRSESPAESLSRAQMFLANLPAPQLQFEIFDDDGVLVARCDFGWPEYKLVGEVDGKFKYGDLLKPGQDPADAIMAEKEREERIRACGWWLTRWDWNIASNLAALTARIQSGFRHAPGSRG